MKHLISLEGSLRLHSKHRIRHSWISTLRVLHALRGELLASVPSEPQLEVTTYRSLPTRSDKEPENTKG